MKSTGALALRRHAVQRRWSVTSRLVLHTHAANLTPVARRRREPEGKSRGVPTDYHWMETTHHVTVLGCLVA